MVRFRVSNCCEPGVYHTGSLKLQNWNPSPPCVRRLVNVSVSCQFISFFPAMDYILSSSFIIFHHLSSSFIMFNSLRLNMKRVSPGLTMPPPIIRSCCFCNESSDRGIRPSGRMRKDVESWKSVQTPLDLLRNISFRSSQLPISLLLATRSIFRTFTQEMNWMDGILPCLPVRCLINSDRGNVAHI